MTLFRVVDIETTGVEPPAEIIEFGRVDLVQTDQGARIERPMARLYRPLRGIPPETMAVHHIRPEDIPEEAPVCTLDKLRQAVFGGTAPEILVAHNSAFEQKFIGVEATDAIPWICTYKSALRVWPEAPGHSNQTLRYWLGLKLDEHYAMPPHRAGPDAWVTAHILAELLKIASANDMIAWTKEPRLMRAVPFGKHRGLAWSAAPLDYLQWMIKQTDMDEDAQWNARNELERRRKGG